MHKKPCVLGFQAEICTELDSSALERPFNFENVIFLLQLAAFNANYQIPLPSLPVHGEVSEVEGTF